MTHNVNPYISVITPFGRRRWDRLCDKRLLNAVRCFAGLPGIEVILFDTSQSDDLQLKEQLNSLSGIKYYHQPEKGVFSPGKTRNHAVAKAKGKYLFFYDADLLCSDDFAKKITGLARELEELGRNTFKMFPCLYLTKRETARIIDRESVQFFDYHQSYLKGENHLVNGIALASSCLLVDKEFFIEIGKFRTQFSGYGCEDLELIHRLTNSYPIGKKPEDYKIDFKCRFPGGYKGFRRYYSYYALPHLFDHNFLLHQWHPRNVNAYHRSREQNESLQMKFMDDTESPESLGSVSADAELPIWRDWIEHLLIENGYSPKVYFGLFRYADGVKEKGVLIRKAKKLLRNPALFFHDALLKKEVLSEK